MTAVAADTSQAISVSERLRRSTSFLLIANVVGAVIALCTEVLLARHLGSSRRGAYALVIAACQIGAVAGSFGLAYIGVREVQQQRMDAGRAAVGAVLTTLPIAVGVATVAAVLLRMAYGAQLSFMTAASVVLTIPAAAVTLNVRLLLVGFGASLKSASTQLVERFTLLALVALIVLPTTSVMRASGALAVAQVATAAVALACLIVVVRRRSPRHDHLRATSRLLLRRGARVVTGNIAQFVNYRLDIFLVIAWRGAREGGIYAVAVSLSSVLWYPADAAAQASYPVACGELREGQFPHRTIRAARIVVLGTALAAVASIPLARIMIPSVFGATFAPSVTPFGILVIGVAALSVTKMLSGILVASGNEVRTSMIAIVAGVVTVAGDLILIPLYGAIGAATASMAAYGASGLLTASSVRRMLRIRRHMILGAA